MLAAYSSGLWRRSFSHCRVCAAAPKRYQSAISLVAISRSREFESLICVVSRWLLLDTFGFLPMSQIPVLLGRAWDPCHSWKIWQNLLEMAGRETTHLDKMIQHDHTHSWQRCRNNTTARIEGITDSLKKPSTTHTASCSQTLFLDMFRLQRTRCAEPFPVCAKTLVWLAILYWWFVHTLNLQCLTDNLWTVRLYYTVY